MDSEVLINCASQIVNGNIDTIYDVYFSTYPNNKLLLFIFTLFFRIGALFSVTNSNIVIFGIVVFQCVLASITGIILYKVVYDITKSKKVSILGFFCYAVLIMFSGCTVITYSDMFGIIFPISIIRLYQKLKQNDKSKAPYLILITILSFIGYKIKPTIIFTPVAIIIIEIINNFKKLFIIDRRKNLFNCLIIVITLLVNILVVNILINTLPLKIDKKMAFTPTHYLMMGLNPKTNGGYDNADALFTIEANSNGNRLSAQLNIIKKRIEEFETSNGGGLLQHYKKKMLTVFNDGTFAWGENSDFFEQQSNSSDGISKWLRNIYYIQGGNNKYLAVIQQLVWLFVLATTVLSILNNQNLTSNVMVLTILFFIAFELLFEVSPRYLIIFVPIFISLSSSALNKAISLINTKISSVKA